MRWFTLIFVSTAVFIGLGPVRAQTPDQPPPAPKVEDAVPAPKKEVVVAPRAGDPQIARRLKNILVATEWFVNPQVAVREGVVFLDGEVQEEIHRKWAGDLARNTQDVVAVVNRIEISREVKWDFAAAQKQVDLLYWQFARSVPLLLLVTFILFLSWAFAKSVAVLARHLLRSRIPSTILLNLVARTLAIPVFLLGLYIVLQVSNMTRLALTVLGGTGLVGLILGFAFRSIAENFLASLFLSIRNPFRTGDYISVDGTEGVVKNLNTRTTVLLTLDGNHVQIPNATVFTNKITNYSTNPYRRSEFAVGVGYDASISKAQEIILKVLKDHIAVLDEPEPLVLVDELAGATVNLRALYWFDSTVYSPIKIRSAVLRLTKRALLEAGISMPDDAREVIFPQGVPIVGIDVEQLQEPADSISRQAPVLPRATELADRATGAEGGLTSDEDEIKIEADKFPSPEQDDNLLRTRKPA